MLEEKEAVEVQTSHVGIEVKMLNSLNTTNVPFDKNAVDTAFNSIVSECKGLSGHDLCKEVYNRSFRFLTIRQVAVVTGLSPVYIRRRTQEGKWSKDYDGSGRVIIPTYEILQYLEEKSHRVGIAYIVYLLPEEEARFKAALPDKELKPRYDAKKAKAYRRRKKAERERGGVARGKLRIIGNNSKRAAQP